MIDFVNEEFFADVNKLAVDYPCIQLVEEHSVATKQDLGKHILDDRITTRALLIQRIQDFTSSETLLFYFEHQVEKGWKHLEVNSKLLLQG